MKETEENLEQKRRVEDLQRNRKEQGITLIALVVTIVVLLILAGITINMLFSNGGIFKTAQDAANAWNQAVINEQADLDNLTEQIRNLVNGQIGGEGETPEDPWIPPTTIEEAIEQNEIFEETKQIKDNYDNIITIPKGFKITNEGKTIPEGIVVEDKNGNQFVWIAVGIVHRDNNPENDVTIELGRYTFNRASGIPNSVQLAYNGETPNYVNEIGTNKDLIDTYYTELSIYRKGVASGGTDGLNATAKNLVGFIESVRKNGGYYLARYEASYGEGYNSEAITDVEKYANAKPLSIVSTGTPRGRGQGSTPLKQGTLWNYVTQLNASKICRNMYENDNTVGVESDLTNSYAYDTAIVFIEKMDASKSNYANANCDTTDNTSLMNTGMTGDKACNIYDMAANIMEWTTEYSTYIHNNTYACPCTSRGGKFDANGHYTSMRDYTLFATYTDYFIGFRPILYIK